ERTAVGRSVLFDTADNASPGDIPRARISCWNARTTSLPSAPVIGKMSCPVFDFHASGKSSMEMSFGAIFGAVFAAFLAALSIAARTGSGSDAFAAFGFGAVVRGV